MTDPVLAAADGIARQILDQTLYARDGRVGWLGPITVDGEVVSGPLGLLLYPGLTGVVLFLAAYDRVCGPGANRELCLRALAPLRSELRELSTNPAQAREVALPVGGLSGLGSLVYSLVTIGELLGEPELFEDARAALCLITPERIAADVDLDVMFGTAGALLACLRLDRATPAPDAAGRTPLAAARQCAEHLAGRSTVWVNPKHQRPVGGFSHGAAGICYALARLAERTGETSFSSAIDAGLAFERTLYVPAERNWRLSWRDDDRFVNTWCNGAPGIAISRLAVATIEGRADCAQEARLALATTQFLAPDRDDYLCCGTLGRVDVLLYAHQELGDPALLAAAQALTRRVLERAEERGGFALMPAVKHVFDPRFFLGLSGIGYTLLRLAFPGLLPCVLALE